MNSSKPNQEISRVRLLSDLVANQIAAGEVVERPASVLKELLENAIDAGASRLDVQVVRGGKRLLEVMDDGIGMTRDDALMAIERHATSKIRDTSDIEQISTLGFRGEALPSMASVSRFSLRTCPRGNTVGTEIILSGGRLQDVRDCGMASGSIVQVRDLFFNLPARRKFLRTEATELSHLRTVFMEHALAHPELSMTMKVDGRRVHNLPRGATLRDRIRDLYGEDFLETLCPLDFSRGDMRAGGFASRPGASRGQRGEQHIFVNHRPAGAAMIHYVVREFYSGGEKTIRPPIFLFIELPYNLVDVNVHPAKREVRFRKPGMLRDFLFEALERSVGAQRFRSSDKEASFANSGNGDKNGETVPLEPREPPLRPAPLPFAGPGFRSKSFPPPFRRPPPPQERRSAEATDDPRAEPSPSRSQGEDGIRDAGPDGEQTPWAWCQILGLIAERYVALETDSGFVVMDPKAAHERILFEALLQQMRGGQIVSQPLLMPQSVALPPADAERLRRNMPTLQKMGFGIHDFGGDHFMVDALPDRLCEAPCGGLLMEIARDLEMAGVRRGSERWLEESIIRSATKAAVRTSHRFTREELDRLVSDLAQAEMPYICPHGRPTMIFTSLNELARRFGRER